jgi:hypothetical protein
MDREEYINRYYEEQALREEKERNDRIEAIIYAHFW